jgi:GH24 family phage-related lysozyme (muramidase)
MAKLINACMAYIEFNEGRFDKRYPDILNIPNIGVGFNLIRENAVERLALYNADRDALLGSKASLSDEQIDALLRHDTEDALMVCKKLFHDFDAFSYGRQIVLIDMSFNLGYSRISLFKNMIAAVNNGLWSQAAKEMQNSRWASQVPQRAQLNILAMISGEEPVITKTC